MEVSAEEDIEKARACQECRTSFSRTLRQLQQQLSWGPTAYEVGSAECFLPICKTVYELMGVLCSLKTQTVRASCFQTTLLPI